MGFGFAAGFFQLFAALISLAFFAIGLFVLVLIISFLAKANKALDIWISKNSEY